jgi:hypothetical protein
LNGCILDGSRKTGHEPETVRPSDNTATQLGFRHWLPKGHHLPESGEGVGGGEICTVLCPFLLRLEGQNTIEKNPLQTTTIVFAQIFHILSHFEMFKENVQWILTKVERYINFVDMS